MQSVAIEMNVDHTAVIVLAQKSGYVSESMLKSEFSWNAERIEHILNALLGDGITWIDDQANERLHWFPSLIGDSLMD